MLALNCSSLFNISTFFAGLSFREFFSAKGAYIVPLKWLAPVISFVCCNFKCALALALSPMTARVTGGARLKTGEAAQQATGAAACS